MCVQRMELNMQDRWRIGVTVAVAFLAGCVVTILCRRTQGNQKRELAELRREVRQTREHELDVLRRAVEYADKCGMILQPLVAHSRENPDKTTPAVEQEYAFWMGTRGRLARMFHCAVQVMEQERMRDWMAHHLSFEEWKKRAAPLIAEEWEKRYAPPAPSAQITLEEFKKRFHPSNVEE